MNGFFFIFFPPRYLHTDYVEEELRTKYAKNVTKYVNQSIETFNYQWYTGYCRS